MKTTTVILSVLLLGCPLMLDAKPPRRPGKPTVRGQINKAVNQIEKENKQLVKDLKAAQDEYPKVQLDLKQTHETYKQAKKELHDQEKALQGRVGTKVGLTEAITAYETADDEYEAASAKLSEELADDESFEKLLAASDEAEDRLEQLRAGSTKGKDSENEAIRQAAKTVLAAKQAIQERIDADAKVKPLLEAKRQAEAEMKDARQKFDKAAKSDPEMKRAERHQRQSREAYHQAQQTAAKLEAKIAAIQQQIATNLMLIGP